MRGQGRLPMTHALCHGRWRVVEELVRYGASPWDQDDCNGDTPIDLCKKDKKNGVENEIWLQKLWPRRPREPRPQRQEMSALDDRHLDGLDL